MLRRVSVIAPSCRLFMELYHFCLCSGVCTVYGIILFGFLLKCLYCLRNITSLVLAQVCVLSVEWYLFFCFCSNVSMELYHFVFAQVCVYWNIPFFGLAQVCVYCLWSHSLFFFFSSPQEFYCTCFVLYCLWNNSHFVFAPVCLWNYTIGYTFYLGFF